MATKYQTSWVSFLKDVAICALGAYGGPEVHFGVFTQHLVEKKHYLSEDELLELIALTTILPGPSSTQTITAIGYKVGGPLLATLTLLVWALPAILIMTLFSFIYTGLNQFQIDDSSLRLIGPMAVGFIGLAAYRLGKKTIKNGMTLSLFLFALGITYFWANSVTLPLVIFVGGFISVLYSKQNGLFNKVKVTPNYSYLISFVLLAVISSALLYFYYHPLIFLFEAFYRFGYLVIGGGQVVIPYMINELVEVHQFMTIQEFLTGYGLVQGIPGPMFSFSAFAGGMAVRNDGAFFQIMASLTAAIGLFLPGTLLIYFVYPIWESLKQMKVFKLSLVGISAVATGLIAAAGIKLWVQQPFTLENFIFLVLTIGLLLSKKIPSPLIVLLAIVAGFILR